MCSLTCPAPDSLVTCIIVCFIHFHTILSPLSLTQHDCLLKFGKGLFLEEVLRKAQVNMKHLLPTLVLILSIIQSGKSMFLVSVQSED